MRKIIVTATVCIVLGIGAGWLLFGPPSKRGIDQEGKEVGGQETSKVRTIAYYKDPMHPWFTSDRPGKAPDCGMDMVPVYEGESDVKGVRIDPVMMQNIGVKTEVAGRRRLSRTIRTVGKVEYDETRLHNINTKIMGWVEKLYVDYTGSTVRKGDPLLDIYSPDLVNTQQEYLLALRYRDRLQASSVEEAKKSAEELVATAKRRLLYWDISPEQIQEIENLGVPKKVMTIYSPADGIVMEKMVVNGQNVMAGMTLYVIADLSRIWVLADIYQYETAWVESNQDAEVELSYVSGKKFPGTVAYVYPFLSEESRTVKVRVEVSNPKGRILLKPGMFATVTIRSPQAVNAIAVPEQSVLRSGERNIVVVSLGGGYFDPREVNLGVIADGYVQVLEGLKEGETIVTSSQFLIDSESNLKAAILSMGAHGGHGMSTPAAGERPQLEQHKEGAMGEPQENGERQGMGEKKSKERDKSAKMQGSEEPGTQAQQWYTCEMHPEVISDKPGDCPKCGMKLVLKKGSN